MDTNRKITTAIADAMKDMTRIELRAVAMAVGIDPDEVMLHTAIRQAIGCDHEIIYLARHPFDMRPDRVRVRAKDGHDWASDYPWEVCVLKEFNESGITWTLRVQSAEEAEWPADRRKYSVDEIMAKVFPFDDTEG